MTVVADTMVDTVVHWIDLVRQLLTTEASHRMLRAHIRQMLASGAIETMKVVEAARAGHQDADLALRELAVEMLDRGEMPPAALRAYAQSALVRDIVPSVVGGADLGDLWLRDVGIACLVQLATEHWPLKPTRNQSQSKPKPSACSIVADALTQRGFKLSERQVVRIFRAHQTLAARLYTANKIIDGS